MSKSSRYRLVRVKAFNARKGYTTRRYTYKGKRFDIDDGWYEVPTRLAEEMKNLKNREGLKIFDIKSLEEAQEIDDVEELPAGPARDADHAARVKPSDFKRHKEVEAAKAGSDADPMDNDPSFFMTGKEARDLEAAMDPANDEEEEEEEETTSDADDDADDDADKEEDEPAPEPAKRSKTRTSKRRSRKKKEE